MSSPSGQDVTSLRDLSPQQWKSGIAAWLGWLFDGLDMNLYVLVATPFVAELLHVTDRKDPQVGYYGSWIQAAFLIGWALGGGFFGRVADRLGRSRALMLTILTYALFTGLAYFAQTWWQLLITRFLAALGIGGEWAVGASLLSETWPRRWRPWMAAVLQTGVNLGILLASLAHYFLRGFPSRHGVSGRSAPGIPGALDPACRARTGGMAGGQARSGQTAPGFLELFRGPVRRTTLLTLTVCGLGLTAHWAFGYWYVQHVQSLPELKGWNEAQMKELVSKATALYMMACIAGNFLAAVIARWLNYRRAISGLFLVYFFSIMATYSQPLDYQHLFYGFIAIGLCQGLFGLFTMYLPPLFPTLLRTTGAGFCYNFGRIAAGFGIVVFGLFSKVGDSRLAILYAGFLFIPAAGVAWLLPEIPDEESAVPNQQPVE